AQEFLEQDGRLAVLDLAHLVDRAPGQIDACLEQPVTVEKGRARAPLEGLAWLPGEDDRLGTLEQGDAGIAAVRRRIFAAIEKRDRSVDLRPGQGVERIGGRARPLCL